MKGGGSMIDFYYQLRQRMIDTLQVSLKQIRQVLGFGVQEFGDIIGLTRQTINNLETRKNRMSAIQYVAICAVIDNYIKDKPDLLPVLSTILCSNDEIQGYSVFDTIENGSFLKKWFLCFPDEAKIIGFSQNEKLDVTNEDFDNIANSYKLFLDETVICQDGFESVIQPLINSLKNSGNKLIIPLKVIESIQYQMINSVDGNIQECQRGMNLLMKLQNEDLIDIRGEKSDTTVISTFVSVFAKFKCVNRLALITQNSKLAKQILSLNNDDIGGFNILVLQYSQGGGIQKWTFDGDDINDFVNENVEQLADIEQEESIDPLKGWESIE